MRNSKPGAVPATGWPFVYLTGTAVSLGLVVGLRAVSSGLGASWGLVAAGVVAGLFAAISALHYYASVRRVPSRIGPAEEP